MKSAATMDRNYRTFLLVAQLEAKAIGLRIKQARDEAGMTQEELADLASGFSKRSLQDYEGGVTIPYKHMQEIASLTGKEVEWLLHGDPEMSEPRVPRSLDDRLAALEAKGDEILDLIAQASEGTDARLTAVEQRLQSLLDQGQSAADG